MMEGFITVVSDITKQKKQELDLIKSNAKNAVLSECDGQIVKRHMGPDKEDKICIHKSLFLKISAPALNNRREANWSTIFSFCD